MYFCLLSSNKKRVIFFKFSHFFSGKMLIQRLDSESVVLKWSKPARLFAGFGTYMSVENLGSFGKSPWNRTNVVGNVQPRRNEKDLRTDAINYLFSWLISVSYVDL